MEYICSTYIGHRRMGFGLDAWRMTMVKIRFIRFEPVPFEHGMEGGVGLRLSRLVCGVRARSIRSPV